MSLSREDENRRMLAALLGIDEGEAARRLNVTIVVTSVQDDDHLSIAKEVHAMLNRTVSATFTVPDAGAAAEVVVGPAAPRTDTAKRVFVCHVADGLLVSRTPMKASTERFHRIFNLLASCYAAGMALRLALGRGFPFGGHDEILVSPAQLLGRDLPHIYRRCHLADTVLAGAGAVGNSFVYALRCFDTSGTLHIVDPKRVHDGILNRCIWFTRADIPNWKADAIAARAQDMFPALQLVPHSCTLKEFYSQDGAPPLRQVVTTVDSRRVRRSIQGELPHKVYDASTTGLAEVVLHFNQQPSDLACLACIYKEDQGELAHEAHVAETLGVSIEEVRRAIIDLAAAEKICRGSSECRPQDLVGKAFDTVFKERCAEGKLLTPEDRQVLAPFCVVSMLAGTFLTLEFVRRINSGRTSSPFNYWRLSPWHGPNPGLRDKRHRLPQCPVCSNAAIRDVMKQLWGDQSS